MSGARIEIRKGIELGSAGSRSLLGDLYLPEPSAASSRPAVVLIFGGGWRSGDRSQQKVYGINLAKAGFVCIATDYRWSTEARWPAQLDDVQTAIRWLKIHASEFSIDPERVAVSGNSSGGHLALMAGAATGDPSLSSTKVDWGDCSNDVSAVCAFYPPAQLNGLDEESQDDTVASLMGAAATPADYDRASPLSHAANRFPPVLLITGSDDRRVPVRHSHDLKDALEEAGNHVDFHSFSGQGHAFDVQLGFAQLCAVIMADFFKRHA